MQSTIDKGTALNKASAHRTPGSLERVSAALPRFFVPAFALMFLTFALLLASSSAFELIRPMLEEGDFFTGLVKGLNIGVVALAVYELAQIVYQEYDHNHELRDVMARTRRGVSRFGSVVVVALVLESLIMVIKYSQQDLAGFLFYPATLILSAAVLLAALGLFARLTET
ncbi:MAG: hypothetical protein ACM3PU_10805 [Gemmatimonadota bacterium]